MYEHNDPKKRGFSSDVESIGLKTYLQYEEAQYDDWMCFEPRMRETSFLNIQPNGISYADAFTYLSVGVLCWMLLLCLHM